MDFTSRNFPFMVEFFDDQQTEEGHAEPASELVNSSVVGYAHPLLSTTQLKETINMNRLFGNSDEKTLTKDINPNVLKNIVQASYQQKFPLEPLIYLLDIEQKLDDRSSAGDANSVIQKVKQYIPQLNSTLGRMPYNWEVMAAYMLGSASQVKTINDNAKNKPYENASPIGSKYDKIIFYKKKVDQKILRKNKEVVQFFLKRMLVGANVFPHAPLSQNGNASL